MSDEKEITVGDVVQLKGETGIAAPKYTVMKAGTWHEDGDKPRRMIMVAGAGYMSPDMAAEAFVKVEVTS